MVEDVESGSQKKIKQAYVLELNHLDNEVQFSAVSLCRMFPGPAVEP